MEWQLDGLEKLDKELSYLRSHGVKIGVLGDDSKDGVSIQDYAIWNEYGTVWIPSRPFFRKALMSRRGQRQITELMNKLFDQLKEGNISGHDFLRVVGEHCKAKLVESITSGGWQANKETTLKYKNQSQPLIDTSSLVSSIDYEIVGV